MQANQHRPPIAPVAGTQQHYKQAAASRAQPRYVVACTSNAQPGPPADPPQQPAGGIPLSTPRFGGGDGSFRRSNTPTQSTNNPQQHNSSSWALMGRVVQSSALDISSNPTPRQRVVIIAAARSIGVSEQEMAGRMQVGQRWGPRGGGCLQAGGGRVQVLSVSRRRLDACRCGVCRHRGGGRVQVGLVSRSWLDACRCGVCRRQGWWTKGGVSAGRGGGQGGEGGRAGVDACR